MADALCGPSNPLQNFQKHNQVDRTLQQDRLVSRQGSSQVRDVAREPFTDTDTPKGFRSGLGANAGLLDPEFEAFQAGHPASPPLHFDNQPFQARFSHPAQQSHFQQPATLPDWANDFQRLHIASPPASTHQTPPNLRQAAIAQQPQSLSSWHQDFLSSQPAPVFQQQPMFLANQQWQPQSHMQHTQFSSISQGKQAVQNDAQFDAAAFEAAFDAAREDAIAVEDDSVAAAIQAERVEIEKLVADKEAEQTAIRQEHGSTNHLSAMDLTSDLTHEEQAILEPDLSPWHDQMMADGGFMLPNTTVRFDDNIQQAEPENKDMDQKVLDDEELSRTAGQLLDSVSHDTSQKFQDSVFLNLMRRLRDRELRVEGENFVEVSEEPL
jgi:hypothetical protein